MVEENDIIDIDIPNRSIQLRLTGDEIAERRVKEERKGGGAFKPVGRKREVSEALKAYALFASSADMGAIRELPDTL